MLTSLGRWCPPPAQRRAPTSVSVPLASSSPESSLRKLPACLWKENLEDEAKRSWSRVRVTSRARESALLYCSCHLAELAAEEVAAQTGAPAPLPQSHRLAVDAAPASSSSVVIVVGSGHAI